MIIEVAEVKIKPGTNAAFEEAVAKATVVFRQAKGCMGLHLQKCVEEPERYQAIIRWETLEDHTIGFREDPLFQEWRGLVGPYFAEPPQVLHYEIAMDRVAFSDKLK